MISFTVRVKKIDFVKILVLFSVLFFFTSSQVFALTISPARVEISGDPGDVLAGEIQLFNNEGSDRTYFVSFENFETRGDTGAPFFTGARDGLATWLNSPSQILLEKDQQAIISYSITIPPNATPGGYFAAIFFGNQPPSSTTGGDVSVGGKIGSLILLRVNGEIQEGGGLVSFGSVNQKKVFTSTPVFFEYGFNNTGGDRVIPKGSVFIKNMFGSTASEMKANPNEGSVLPSSMRKFTMIWGEEFESDKNFIQTTLYQLKNFKFGVYTASISLVWGDSAQTSQENFRFFMIPWQILSVIFVVLFLFLIIFKIVLRRYNAMILRQAGLYQKNIVENAVPSDANQTYTDVHMDTSQNSQPDQPKPRRRI